MVVGGAVNGVAVVSCTCTTAEVLRVHIARPFQRSLTLSTGFSINNWSNEAKFVLRLSGERIHPL